MPGSTKTSVYAYTSELDRWLESLRAAEGPTKGNTEEDAPSLPGSAPATPAAAELTFPYVDRRRPAPVRRTSRRRWLAASLAVVLIAVAFDFVVRVRAIPLVDKLHNLLARPAGHVLHADASEAKRRLADDFYLRGRYEWNQRTPESLHRALDLFTQAIDHDPDDARAYAGLADTYDLLREYSTDADADVFPRAIAAARKAVALDGSLAEAHRALAFAEMYGGWDFAGAETEFRRAIELDPRDPQAHRWYANALALAGRYPEARAEIDRAQVLDPTSHATLADKGWMLFGAARAQEGIDLLKEVERSAPGFRSPHYYLMQADLDLHDYPSFLSEGERAAQLAGDTSLGEIVASARKGYQGAGSQGLLQALYTAQKAHYAQGAGHPVSLAKTCLLLGKRQEALDFMEDAYRRHDFEVLTLLSDRDLLSLKADPRYQSLVQQINYPKGPVLISQR